MQDSDQAALAVAAGDDAPNLPARTEPHLLSTSLRLLSEPTGIEAETIRALRTRIVAQHLQNGRRALAVCTPAAGSGASFVASNLAVAMAQIGVKTALVDADLRTPSVGRLFGLDAGAAGLSDYLSERVDSIDEIATTDILPDLGVIPAGTSVSNPQELLANSRFRTLLNQLFREFDLTLFDTSAANLCADAQRVATVAGYSVIVARRHHTYVKDVATLAKLLQADGSTVIGSVLNDF